MELISVTREDILSSLATKRLIAILRGDFGGAEVEIAEALVEGGITHMEVSLVSKDGLAVLARIARALEGRATVGAGTVLTLRDLQQAVAAGARFIVSPDTNPEVVEQTLRLDCCSFPGAFTPTEIVRALNCGADAVKLFPAGSLGPDFVRGVRGPMPGVRLVPTGGVNEANIPTWFNAGAFAVAASSELIDHKTVQRRAWMELSERAKRFAETAQGGPHAR
jgi:2-dehydro-3-deoxyphosphogluconate aldolase/(4S)-4-hydroxy-2-oxoglutarate aldolase